MDAKELGVNGSLKLNVTLMAILNVTRNDLLEKFSLVFKKDSFRIIMALLAHYDLELHQMDVKIAFLNENFENRMFIWIN